MLFSKTFSFEIMLFKTARKTQSLRILRGKMSQNVIFCLQFFFQKLFYKSVFFFKIVLFKNIFSSKTCFLKVYFSLKSDAS